MVSVSTPHFIQFFLGAPGGYCLRAEGTEQQSSRSFGRGVDVSGASERKVRTIQFGERRVT